LGAPSASLPGELPDAADSTGEMVHTLLSLLQRTLAPR
jgi:hypothetical protein